MPDEPSKEVILDSDLFADFCKHLSASLNVLDFVKKTRQLGRFDPVADDPIVLAVEDPKLMSRLIEMQYPELILSCVKNLRLHESCADVFLSEIASETVAVFISALEHLTQVVWTEVDERGILIHSSSLISDLIISPIGRVHHETVKSLGYFMSMIDAVGGDPTKMFLNAKSPTPESQYIQIWVSRKLGIPPAPDFGMIAVV